MSSYKLRSFLHWASRCLAGHIIIFQIFFTVPMFVMSLRDDYADGAMTLDRTLKTAFAAILGGLAVATLGWYTITRPMIDRGTKARDGSPRSR